MFTFSEKFQVQFLEDNQATITMTTKGDSEKMRHTDRTQRISFRWLKQQFERGLFIVINVGTDEQVADIFIFTRPFADKTKWNKARLLSSTTLIAARAHLQVTTAKVRLRIPAATCCADRMFMDVPLRAIRTSNNTNNMTG